MNYGETMSTLLFASRCMAINQSMPVQHAEVDYAELCVALQAKGSMDDLINMMLYTTTNCNYY